MRIAIEFTMTRRDPLIAFRLLSLGVHFSIHDRQCQVTFPFHLRIS